MGINDTLSKPIYKKKLLYSIAKNIGLEYTNPGNESCIKSPPSLEYPLDYKAFLEELGDKDVALSILMGFISSVEKQLVSIKKGIVADDHILVHREAHSIKGGAGNVFAAGLISAAEDLEYIAKQGKLEESNVFFDKVFSEFKILKHYVSNELLENLVDGK